MVALAGQPKNAGSHYETDRKVHPVLLISNG